MVKMLELLDRSFKISIIKKLRVIVKKKVNNVYEKLEKFSGNKEIMREKEIELL